MAVVIRMRRTGRRNRPCYRISVCDSRMPRDGRAIEALGLYDPIAPKVEARLKLDVERARHWVGEGALPSETVASIFKREGVYEGLPTKKPRSKRARGKKTATRTQRDSAKADREVRKQGRRTGRVEAKRAALAAAAAAAKSEAS